MLIDAQALLWDAAALTSDAASTNTYDSGAAGNDISVGDPLGLFLQVDVSADHTTGNETYNFAVIESASADLSTPNTLVSATILYSDLAAGKTACIPIPPGAKTLRYLGAYFDGGGTTPTITVTAWIAPLSTFQKDKVYPKGYTVS